MSTATPPPTHLVEYSVSDEAIAMLRERLEGKTAGTPAEYKEVREGIAEVRELRVQVEKTRKELKAGALEYGRKVDTEAKRITALLLEIEQPLKLAKQEVDDEKKRIKREAEEAEQRRIEEIRRKAQEEQDEIDRKKAEAIKAEQEAEQRRLDAERAELEKEQAKLRKAQEAEDNRRRIEQEKLDAAKAEQEAKLAAERAEVEAERKRIEDERLAQEAKARAEREAKEQAAREEADRLAKIEAAKAEAERLEAMRPDIEKLTAFAATIRSIKAPELGDSEAIDIASDALHTIWNVADEIEARCKAKVPALPACES